MRWEIEEEKTAKASKDATEETEGTSIEDELSKLGQDERSFQKGGTKAVAEPGQWETVRIISHQENEQNEEHKIPEETEKQPSQPNRFGDLFPKDDFDDEDASASFNPYGGTYKGVDVEEKAKVGTQATPVSSVWRLAHSDQSEAPVFKKRKTKGNIRKVS